ncbi:hypothetical protein VP01_4883g3 [Puccinia sorghi]|uniref:Retrovirus-related Pol polyprotein from transposon TNT 1-94-like beta-barrel domain-containing protein n=1 Tax=Puccinia sorghi TaxID=27349 RepID=A0A0L6UM93_9BASI|nr:hypothetical protein VP01_4883g3 [Puccinia sorghi]
MSKKGFHNPKQDENHSSDNCWHLHPETAPDWWKESQTQWKATQAHGATAHIFNNTRFFESLDLKQSDFIKTGKQGATLPIEGRGAVRLKWGQRTIQLENCLFVPTIMISLISAGKLDAQGCALSAKHSKFLISKNGKMVLQGRINKVYSLSTIQTKSETCRTTQ